MLGFTGYKVCYITYFGFHIGYSREMMGQNCIYTYAFFDYRTCIKMLFIIAASYTAHRDRRSSFEEM